MTDAGFTNPSGAITYLILVLFPTMLCIITPIIKAICASYNTVPQHTPQNTVYQTIYTAVPAKTKPRKTSENKPKQQQITPEEPETSDELVSITRQALVKLGYKVRDAKSVIEKMCKNKCYTSEIDLIQDCISYTHKTK